MTRALIPLALAATAYALANALADADYLIAFPLTVVLAAGIWLLACDATPGASALPAPADATEDSVSATTEAGR